MWGSKGRLQCPKLLQFRQPGWNIPIQTVIVNRSAQAKHTFTQMRHGGSVSYKATMFHGNTYILYMTDNGRAQTPTV